ncbi:MAG: hypothetical protein LBU87_02290 [Lactobacillales bacterium]|jgi:hypothetical protein|nr:hypothetical protein [Lactobacillales bacterium]
MSIDTMQKRILTEAKGVVGENEAGISNVSVPKNGTVIPVDIYELGLAEEKRSIRFMPEKDLRKLFVAFINNHDVDLHYVKRSEGGLNLIMNDETKNTLLLGINADGRIDALTQEKVEKGTITDEAAARVVALSRLINKSPLPVFAPKSKISIGIVMKIMQTEPAKIISSIDEPIFREVWTHSARTK